MQRPFHQRVSQSTASGSPYRAARLLAMWGAAMWSAVMLAGCSDGGQQGPHTCVPVTGKVMYAAHPAAGAQVSLVPEVASLADWPLGYPRGTVADDGSLVISTFKPGDGAPIGAYKIAVYWPSTPIAAQSDREEDLEPLDRLYGKFSTPATSPLRAVIEPSSTELSPIDLSLP